MKFSIIIPTMWFSDHLKQMIRIYLSTAQVSEVIIIDNRPSHNFLDGLQHHKLIIIKQDENIFVNPAWNLGVATANYMPILANDDILISNLPLLLQHIDNAFTNQKFDLIGASVNNYGPSLAPVNLYDKTRGFPRRSFGCFMAVRNYSYIPEQLRVYSGDVFLFERSQKTGIIGRGFINTPVSATISQLPDVKQLAMSDVAAYSLLNQERGNGLNIIIRTSGRPNYFAACIQSVRQFSPDALLHITIDSPDDLAYVIETCAGLHYNYYMINKETVELFCKGFRNTRKPFIFNHYFNIVRPFLKGLVMFLDDDDQLLASPPLFCEANSFLLFNVIIGGRVVPEPDYKETITLNHISSLSVVVPAKILPLWNPQRGGDFDLINKLSQKYKPIWSDIVLSGTQTKGNNGKRNDL